jgi:hypothetical protein
MFCRPGMLLTGKTCARPAPEKPPDDAAQTQTDVDNRPHSLTSRPRGAGDRACALLSTTVSDLPPWRRGAEG